MSVVMDRRVSEPTCMNPKGHGNRRATDWAKLTARWQCFTATRTVPRCSIWRNARRATERAILAGRWNRIATARTVLGDIIWRDGWNRAELPAAFMTQHDDYNRCDNTQRQNKSDGDKDAPS